MRVWLLQSLPVLPSFQTLLLEPKVWEKIVGEQLVTGKTPRTVEKVCIVSLETGHAPKHVTPKARQHVMQTKLVYLTLVLT